jgi:hypothetical protein
VAPTAIIVIVIKVPSPAIIIVMFMFFMTMAARDGCQLLVSEFNLYLWLKKCVHSKHSFQAISVSSINNAQ